MDKETNYKELIPMEEIKKGLEEKDNQVIKKPEAEDYLKLLAAHKESERRIKIRSVIETINDEKKKKWGAAIIAGTAFAGLVVATHFSGVNTEEAIQTEIKALQSFDALKDYLSSFTPAMWGTMAVTVAGLSRYISARKKEKKASEEFKNITDNEPISTKSYIESEAKKIK